MRIIDGRANPLMDRKVVGPLGYLFVYLPVSAYLSMCDMYVYLFPRASERRVLPIVGSAIHVHILTSSHLHTYACHLPISSHILIFTYHLLISHPLILTSAHIILTSSHLLIFTSAHIIFTPSPLLIFTHVICTSSLLQISSSHLHFSHPPSLSLSRSLSPTSSFYPNWFSDLGFALPGNKDLQQWLPKL